MKLLLDTNVLVALVRRETAKLGRTIESVFSSPRGELSASVANLWEIAIKTRLGKLDVGLPLESLPGYFRSSGLRLLVIDEHHVLALVEPAPATRDPFDRLLLAQCQVEALRLVTTDRALSVHPLAWTPA